MPIWLIVIIILVLIYLIYSLFSWIGDHIVYLCITAVAIALIVALGRYFVSAVPALIAIALVGFGCYRIYKYFENREEQKKDLNKKKEYIEEVEKLKLDSEVEEVLIKGYSFVESLRAYNDKIPDEKMSESIDQLESTTKKIFDEVRLHPDKISKLRKLMDYYLPTVDGILSKYAGYDANEISSENIEDSKAKVSESMDIINEGFNNILNSLFSEDKMDITSEVVVLKQMFEGDGLIDPRIKKNKETENNELKK